VALTEGRRVSGTLVIIISMIGSTNQPQPHPPRQEADPNRLDVAPMTSASRR